MIKMINFLRRREGMSSEAFHAYWLEKHAPLVREVSAVLGVWRYVQSHAERNTLVAAMYAARGNPASPHDGVAELWWDSAEALLAVGTTKDGRDAGRRLKADELNFIDVPHSSAFIVQEHEVIALHGPG